MFRLSSHLLAECSILLVEDDDGSANALTAAIARSGGTFVGRVSTVEEGLRFLEASPAELVMIHIRYTARSTRMIPQAFADRGARTVFLACHDDWFDFDDDDGGLPVRIAG